jgi:hypothetical protein
MDHRRIHLQLTAAAKVGISERSGRRPWLLPQTLFVKAAGCDWSSSHYGRACPPD